MSQAPIKTYTRNRTGVIELNRPKALNSLNLEMVELISQALENWRHDDGVEQVLVFSNHPKAFCAGGDVRAIRELVLEGKLDEADHYFDQEYALDHTIATYPKPYISVADGVIMGGGVGISAHGSHLIVTDKAFASMPEMVIGYVTDVGMAYHSLRLDNCSPAMARFWGLTGYRMYAADMLYTGLAQGMVEDAHSYIEDVIALGVDNVPVAGCGQEPPLKKWEADIDKAFSHSQWEDILANCSDALRVEVDKLMAKASPTSIVAALELYDFEEKASNLREALDAELRLGKYLIRQPDFAEGVRAVLVDKTQDAAFLPRPVDPQPIRNVL